MNLHWIILDAFWVKLLFSYSPQAAPRSACGAEELLPLKHLSILLPEASFSFIFLALDNIQYFHSPDLILGQIYKYLQESTLESILKSFTKQPVLKMP